MKNILKLASFVLGFSLFAATSYAQTALTQTSLAASQGAGPAALASGLSSNLTFTVSLASATGVNQANNGQPITVLYIDQEAEAVLTLVTGQTTIFNVLRGQFGTKESPHANGAMVLLGTITPQFGGFQGSGGLQVADPPINGACSATSTNQTPWLNMTSSAQWLCSTVTGTWVAGWNNPFVDASGPTAAVASAAGLITPSGPLFHITGALAITGFNIPVGFNKGCFTVINDGAYTWTAANNIALASAAAQVVGQTNTFCYDPNTAKFYPAHQ